MNALAPMSGESDLVNYDAEKAFLGACLANNDAWHRMADRLLPDHFADALHARIYDAIGKLITRGVRADNHMLVKQFERDAALAEIGGTHYLLGLAQSVVTVRDSHDYGEQIIDLWRRRQIAAAAGKAVAEVEAFAADRSANDVLESLEVRLSDIAASGTVARAILSAADAVNLATASADGVRKRGGSMGVPTGLGDLDRILSGMHRPDLVILAGRPSMGKTALATNIGFNAAKRQRADSNDGNRVVVFSLEMSSEQLGQRLISMETGISVDRQRSGFASEDDIEAMVKAGQRLDGVSMLIDDDASLTVQGMTSRARRVQRRQGLDLVIVDHLGRARMPKGDRATGLYERTTTMVRDFKTMAKVLNVPVLLLVQLSRAVEQRDDKRPQLSDLRDSGAIEEEADVVMFVYREEYYLERSEPKPGIDGDEKHQQRKRAWDIQMNNAHNIAEVIVAKNRQGAIRSTKLRFDGPTQVFQDLQT